MLKSESNVYGTMKINSLFLLCEYCEVSAANVEHLNNDFCVDMAAQLFRSYANNSRGHLNDSQVNFVKLSVKYKWDGTPNHYRFIFNKAMESNEEKPNEGG